MTAERPWPAFLVCAVMIATCLSDARATWSIIIVDRATREIAVGSATCVPNINLQRETPVLLVGVGAATAQSFVDTTGGNRMLIWDEFQNGTDPQAILKLLRQQDSAHQTRQYGIADTLGRAVTFSGRANGAFAGGVVGQFGTITYAVQGNVLTGQAVVDAAEAAILNTPGDLAKKLMAAMEAARDMGGDGRCSCSPADPTGCGDPPPNFDKAAHVGYMIVARRGDIDGNCNGADGCANGVYFLNKNVKNKRPADPDPVVTMRLRFDRWRTNQIGRPDQVASTVVLARPRMLPGAENTTTMTIQILDWQGQPAQGVQSISVMHDPLGSAGSSTIGPVTTLDAQNQIYEVQITAGTQIGIDTIAVLVHEQNRQRFLMPGGKLAIQDPRGDFNLDGVVDLTDLGLLLFNFGRSGPGGGDFDGDDDTDLTDLAELLRVPGLGSLN